MKNMKTWFQLSIAALAMFAFVACKEKSETASYPSDEVITPNNNSDSALSPLPGSVENENLNKDQASTEDMNTSNTEKTKTVTHKKLGRTIVGSVSQDNSANQQMNSSADYSPSFVQASYPGGQTALENYIAENVNYPDAAVNNEVQGTVQVQFTVDEKGKISNVHALSNNLGNGLEEEAIRVISNLPRWTPAKMKGKSVKSDITVPITFRIDE